MLQNSPMFAYIPATNLARAREFKEVAELKERGVVFEEYDFPQMKTVNGIATGGGAKAAWFKDSEGNTMAIIQDY